MKLSRKYKPYLICIASSLAFLLFFALFKTNKAAMNALVMIADAYHKVSSAFCAFLPFSVAELFYTSVLIVAAICIVVTGFNVLKFGVKRISSLVRLGLGLCSAVLCICACLSLFWGAKYYANGFEEKSKIIAQPISAQQLYSTTSFFVEKLQETYSKVKRDERSVCNESISDAMQKSKGVYRPLEEIYPFLKGNNHAAKPMAYSKFFSMLGFTGYFFPFTGESNINIDTPPVLVPSTIAHEIAHVRGVAPEQTANFVAIRACEESGDSFYEYSGWLLGYIHLSNALFSANYEGYMELAARLPNEVKEDLRADREYWRQFESPVQEAASGAYSGFLQSYDQALGVKSYGACVDLLCAFYGNN